MLINRKGVCMKCPNCGIEVLPNVTFCPICGSNIPKRASRTTRPAISRHSLTKTARTKPAKKPKVVKRVRKAESLVTSEDYNEMLCPSCDTIVKVPKRRPVTVKCPKCHAEYFLT